MKPIILILTHNQETLTKKFSFPNSFAAETLLIESGDEAKAINKWVSAYKGNREHIILLPENSILLPLYEAHALTYFDKEISEVLLPLVELTERVEGEVKFKAFLNSYIWQSSMVEDLGFLDLKLAKQQIDNTLYGALIPIGFLKEHKFDETMPCYYQNEWMCRVIESGLAIKGIPKVVAKLIDCDYTYSTALEVVKKECFEKVLNFKSMNVLEPAI